MGIVFKQSLSNLIITYVGFGIGAINTLFLYTQFLTDAYYGLVGVILSTSAILMPLMAFGVPNTIVKYYSNFQHGKTLDGFLTLMLLLPLLLIIPIALLSFMAEDAIGLFLANKNLIVKDYVWYIFLIAIAMAYFEIFYAWSKVQMRSVFGNFMKEVFVRVGVSVLLLLVYFDVISVSVFLKALVGVYLLRTFLMKLYVVRFKMIRIQFRFPKMTRDILTYSTLIILGGSTAVVLLEIDRFMINQFIQIENVAYYTVAIFIASVIAVPSRAMHQITYPLTAELMNRKDLVALKKLYQKSSLTLFIVAGLVFALIVLNLNDLFLLVPEAYRGGFYIVGLIGLAKVFDALLGNNNAILFNSDYYRALLLMGAFLAICAVLLNIWLIPVFGINGAAIASFSAVVIYNGIKLIYVKSKFKIQPFTRETGKVLLLLVVVCVLFYALQFSFHPMINITLKSILICAMYIGILYRFKISEDVFGILTKYLGPK